MKNRGQESKRTRVRFNTAHQLEYETKREKTNNYIRTSREEDIPQECACHGHPGHRSPLFGSTDPTVDHMASPLPGHHVFVSICRILAAQSVPLQLSELLSDSCPTCLPRYRGIRMEHHYFWCGLLLSIRSHYFLIGETGPMSGIPKAYRGSCGQYVRYVTIPCFPSLIETSRSSFTQQSTSSLGI